MDSVRFVPYFLQHANAPKKLSNNMAYGWFKMNRIRCPLGGTRAVNRDCIFTNYTFARHPKSLQGKAESFLTITLTELINPRSTLILWFRGCSRNCYVRRILTKFSAQYCNSHQWKNSQTSPIVQLDAIPNKPITRNRKVANIFWPIIFKEFKRLLWNTLPQEFPQTAYSSQF